METVNEKLIRNIKAFDDDTALSRTLLPHELIPLIRSIQRDKEKLNFDDYEGIVGKAKAKAECDRIAEWNDSRNRVLRDYIVNLSRRLALDLLFFRRVGLLAAQKKGMRAVWFCMLRNNAGPKLRHPCLVALNRAAERSEDWDYFISLGEVLRKIKRHGRRSNAKIYTESSKESSIATAELLTQNWTSLKDFKPSVKFTGWHHRPIGLCDFSNESLDNFCSIVLPNTKSDVHKIRSRLLGLVQYSRKPLVTSVHRRASLIACS